jgi:hypothetical protein
MNRPPDRPGSAPSGGAALRLALLRARRRWWGSAVTRVFAAALLAALAAVPARWRVAIVRGDGGALLPAHGAALLPAALVVAAVVAAAGVALALLRAPSLLALAQQADHLLAQEQRLSTALEVLDGRTATSKLSPILLAEADARAPTLAWSTIGRIPGGRAWAIALAAAGSLAGAALMVPVPTFAGDRAPSTLEERPLSADRAAGDAASALRVAELLERVAESERSTYLQAVATAFRDYAEELAGDGLSESDAARRVEELLEHLASAAEEVGGSFAESMRAAFEAGAPARPQVAAAEGAGGSERSEDERGDGAEAGTEGVPEPPVDADASMFFSLESVIRGLENVTTGVALVQRRPRPGADDEGLNAFYGGVARAERDPNAIPPEGLAPRSEGAGAGEAVGAAEASSDREGDAAGAGSAALEGQGDLRDDVTTTAHAALPRNERADGRFVEVDLLPEETGSSAGRALERSMPERPFRGVDEAAAAARWIGAAHRDAVSRYFMPGAVVAGASP